MRTRLVAAPAVALWAMLLWSVPVGAQETGVSGTVTDATDAVLPGVTLTAVHVATGNSFTAVTDAAGAYRIPALRPGVYRITAELSGFAPITDPSIELLVGQQAVRNFKMRISALQESITVTSEAPLLEVRQSTLGGNVDTRQMQELPVNGRNWMQLTMLAPGSRLNATPDAPLGNMAGAFQINMDGQQVTTNWSVTSLGEAHFSRDAIEEFQMVNSRFDATQGRSLGMQVNAVTKGGTNRYAGTLSGYFRDDSLNQKDFVLNRVLPYSNQQVSGTFGGPIRQDKLHFFGNYEYNREPQTIAFITPYPRFNIPDLKSKNTQNYEGGRVDAVLSSHTRLMVRGSAWQFDNPITASGTGQATGHPSTLQGLHNVTAQAFASLSRSSDKTLNVLKGGYTLMELNYFPLVNSPTPPQILLQGFTIGRGLGTLVGGEHVYSVRDDLTLFRGRQELKFGGEFLLPVTRLYYETAKYGVIDATLGPPPANLQDLFPVWNDPTTWNLAALSPITRRVLQSVGSYDVHCADGPSCRRRKPEAGAWFQDNWSVASRLTLNLGVRWDFAQDGMAQDFDLPPIHPVQPQEWFNIEPRLGFAYTLSDKTVLRGGWGLYYAGINDRAAHSAQINNVLVTLEKINDGRPNFAADPFNLQNGGHIPTFAEAVQQRGQNPYDLIVIYEGKTPYSYQTSFGFQRQIGQTTAFQADYVWVAGRREPQLRNANVSFDPTTGVNFPFTDISHRPYPQYGLITLVNDDQYSNYHALEMALTKRLSHRWQASATYTLSGYWNWWPEPINPGCAGPVNGFTMTCSQYFRVAPDLGGDYSLVGAGGWQSFGAPDQRHRAVLNGIWDLPAGLQVSGLYHFGSGTRYSNTYGADLRAFGGNEGGGRLRPDGTIIPRNSLVGDPIHRVDVRLHRRFPLGRGTAAIDPMIEVFNLFNHANYGSYVTVAASQLYGRPAQNLDVAYQPRIVQLGFRVAF